MNQKRIACIILSMTLFITSFIVKERNVLEQSKDQTSKQILLECNPLSASFTKYTDLSNINTSFIGEDEYDWSGSSVVGVGDVNNDGYDDILIGSLYNDDSGDFGAGKTY